MEQTLPKWSSAVNTEHRERSAATLADGLLFEDFMRARDKSRHAVVALNERLMIMNVAASEVLNPCEQPRLWKLAQDGALPGGPQIKDLPLSNGKSVMASHRPVVRDGTMVGILVQFSMPDDHPGGREGVDNAEAVPANWQGLTKTERQVAQVVACGLTNREAGRRIYMSPHTVDAHLRHIFRKLDINSRVELARIVGQLHRQLPRPESGETDGNELRRPRGSEPAWSA
jgi:DNA-binding CsgD family transcriptional regulator